MRVWLSRATTRATAGLRVSSYLQLTHPDIRCRGSAEATRRHRRTACGNSSPAGAGSSRSRTGRNRESGGSSRRALSRAPAAHGRRRALCEVSQSRTGSPRSTTFCAAPCPGKPHPHGYREGVPDPGRPRATGCPHSHARVGLPLPVTSGAVARLVVAGGGVARSVGPTALLQRPLHSYVSALDIRGVRHDNC